MRLRILLLAFAAFAALEGSAPAQAMFSASIGKTFGGDALAAKNVWAVAIGGGGAHGIGSELEFSETRNFYDTPDGKGSGKITTLMPSVFVMVPVGKVRPYGIFGFGFIRQRREGDESGLFSDISDNDIGYNIGGGVTFQFARSAGIRADLRRFKVRTSDGISFNRFLVGLVLGG